MRAKLAIVTQPRPVTSGEKALNHILNRGKKSPDELAARAGRFGVQPSIYSETLMDYSVVNHCFPS